VVDAELIGDLRAVQRDGLVLTSPEDLIVYGYDGTWLERRADVVVLPTTTAEVSAVMRVAARHRVPVIPRGGGSGLAGGAVPDRGGIILGTSRMNRILSIDETSGIAVVEPGVINAALQNAVEQRGLFYPPDPASLNQATIGGNVATAASGPRCLKYGGTRDYVVGLEVVLPDATLLRLGGRSPQPSADQPLIGAFIGSEGTLGVVTEITVRLLPKPAERGTVMATFGRLSDAGRAVGEILAAGVVPLALEMMDQTTLRCVEEYLGAGLPVDAAAMLLIDVDGDAAAVAVQRDVVAATCQASNARDVRVATTAEESLGLWRARRSVSSSFGRLRPNKLGEDISVPRSAIPAVVAAVADIAQRYNLLIPLFGHIGDGNLHPNILCDLRDPAEMRRVAEAAREIFSVAVAHGGTLSGEHGIGLLKRDFLPSFLDHNAFNLMRQIKAVVDPNGLLNPGKLFD